MKTYVLDTGVVLEALLNPTGRAGEYLRGARRLEIGLAANIGLALEYEAICNSHEHQEASGLSPDEGKALGEALVALLSPVETRRLWHPRLRDPTDELVLEAAVNGRVDAIVTYNPKDFSVASDRFGIEVITPDN
jgi:predicted nucleic acid-binding protein